MRCGVRETVRLGVVRIWYPVPLLAHRPALCRLPATIVEAVRGAVRKRGHLGVRGLEAKARTRAAASTTGTPSVRMRARMRTGRATAAATEQQRRRGLQFLAATLVLLRAAAMEDDVRSATEAAEAAARARLNCGGRHNCHRCPRV